MKNKKIMTYLTSQIIIKKINKKKDLLEEVILEARENHPNIPIKIQELYPSIHLTMKNIKKIGVNIVELDLAPISLKDLGDHVLYVLFIILIGNKKKH